MNPRRLAFAPLLLAIATLACRSSTPADPDGGSTSADAGLSRPSLPALRDWTCPSGWQAHRVGLGSEGEHAVCAPPTQLDCAAGEAQFLGETSCRKIGEPCPAGGAFPDEGRLRALAGLPAAKIWYVLAGSSGQGELASPFGSVGQALAASRDGDLIAIGQGEYKEALLVQKGVALVGACVSGTRLVAPTADSLSPTLLFEGSASARIANLRLGGDRTAVRVNGPHRLTMNAVEIAESQGVAVILASQAVAELREVVVRDTRSRADGTGGLGLHLTSDVRLRISRSVFLRNRDTAILAKIALGAIPSQLDFDDIVIRDTRSMEKERSGGIGLWAMNGIKLTLKRALLERNRQFGLFVNFLGAHVNPAAVTLEDVVVRDTQAQESDGRGGLGLGIANSTLTGRRLLLLRNQAAALFLHHLPGGPAPTAALEDVVVQDTAKQLSDGNHGEALIVLARELVLRRALLEGNRSSGLVVSHRDPRVDEPMSLQVEDLLVRRTQEGGSDGSEGSGLVIVHARAKLSRVLLAENTGYALIASVGGTLDGTDLLIRSTRSKPSDQRAGEGIQFSDGTSATLERVLLQGNREASLLLGTTVSTAAPPRLKATHLTIDGTLAAACADLAPGAPGSCKDSNLTTYGGGSGLAVLQGAQAEVQSFDISRSFLAGVLIGKGSSLRLESGSIRQNAIGANVQEPAFNQEQIINETVRYSENETNLSSETLPVPVCKIPVVPSF